MDFLTLFLGRLHPLLVHLPIGVLLLAFLFECLSVKKRYRRLKNGVQPALFWGTFFAIAAAISGYFLRQEGGYDETLATRHQNAGIATATVALILYILRPKVKYWMTDPVKKRRVRITMFAPVILLLLITGHWGGSLTHGEDYLFAVVAMEAQSEADPADKIRMIANVPDAVLFRDVIQPIFEARCYDCHSSRKQKGELRLDREELVLKGGKSGALFADGPADSSLLFHLLTLPLEDEDHMPPNERRQLSSSEITLIQYWIEEKAPFDQAISQFEKHDKIASIIENIRRGPGESWIPSGAVSEASEESLERLARLGISVMPLAENSNYLMVTFTGFREVSDEQVAALQEIRDQLVWVDLNNTFLRDEHLDAITRLANLRVLYLNNTPVTDEGVSKLASLSALHTLSLVGTKVTDQSVPVFLGIGKLTRLFLFGTAITESGIKALTDGREGLKVDTGNYRLEQLPTDTIVYRKTGG